MIAGLHIRASHLRLIAGSHVRNSLRSGAGVIFLVMSMLIGLSLASLAVLPVEMAMKTLDVIESGRGVAEGDNMRAVFDMAVAKWGPGVLETFVGTSPEQSRFLLHDKPALISLFFIFLLWFLPFLSFLAGFNQTAGDINSRGLRYLLLRTERANIYLGRMIGTYLFTLAVITVIIAVVGIYVIVKVKFYSTGDVVLWLVRGWFAAAIFVAPWIAFSAWISAAIAMPFLSLVVNALGLGFWVIMMYILANRLDELAYAKFATPYGFKWWLIDPSLGKMFGAVLIMLGFTAVLTLLGLRTFHRRDV